MPLAPKISVIIPSYNHEKFIRGTIESVLNQTFQDFEIVITDDGSTDNSVEIIKSIGDDRIRLFQFKTNRGACSAVNYCVKNSRGKYIAMLSSDDMFKPEKLEKQFNYLEKNKNKIAVFSYPSFIDEHGKVIPKKKIGDWNKVFYQPNRNSNEWLNFFIHNGNAICHPTMLIRKECYDSIGLYDERLAGLPDFDFWIRLLINKFEIHIITEELIFFRVLNKNLNASGDRLENHIRNAFEFTCLLNNFLNISDKKVLLEVFPEIAEEINPNSVLSQELIKFYIAIWAFNRKNYLFYIFSLQTLFELLGNKKSFDIIHKETGFDYPDFNKLTQKADIFNRYYLMRSKWYKYNLIFKTILKNISKF